MKFSLFLFAFFGFMHCFAQTNQMKYFYQGKFEEAIPDFAAMAVLERQNCPNLVDVSPIKYLKQEKICVSSYRIIRFLDVTSDTLKKEYIEAKEGRVLPYFRHRPILIFGKQENGTIQIMGHEEMREYFNDINCRMAICIGDLDLRLRPFLYQSRDRYIHALHSIGTPYYNINNLDSFDVLFYDKYLMPYIKHEVEYNGKDFNKLQQRLTQNREPIKATKIRNGFAALGVIKSTHHAKDSKRANIYELRFTVENLLKNDAKINSNIAIFIDKERLPPYWSCLNSESTLYDKPLYFFGDLKNGSLFIDSLVSPQDAFVFGDTIYDISMGFPLKELIAYILPLGMPLEELEFYNRWNAYLDFVDILNGELPEFMDSLPACLRNDVKKTFIKWRPFFDNRKKLEDFREAYINMDDETKRLFQAALFGNAFRCRGLPDNAPPGFEKLHGCRYSELNNEGVWGRKW